MILSCSVLYALERSRSRMLNKTVKRSNKKRIFFGNLKRSFCRIIFIAFISFVISQLLAVDIKLSNAQSPSPIQKSGAELIQVAKQQYDRSQFDDSATTLQQALQVYEASGEQLEAVRTLSLLSLVYEQLRQWQMAEQALSSSLSLLKQISATKGDRQVETEFDRVRAQVLNRQGRWQLSTGKVEASITSARQAESLYAKFGDLSGVIGSKINQAQALEVLGFYRQAKKLYRQIEQELVSMPDTEIKMTGLHNLGNLLRQEGNLNRSQKILLQALNIAQKQSLTASESQILLSLGNTERVLAEQVSESLDSQPTKHRQQTLEYYQQAAQIATSSLIKTQAQLNQLSFLIEIGNQTRARQLIPAISQKLANLPGGRSSIYARLNFAQSMLLIQQHLSNREIEKNIIQNLNLAIEQSQAIKDVKAESYALGILGKWYENTTDWSRAEQVTESALAIAQGIDTPELLYQWQWQMGRIIQAKVKTEGNAAPQALAYYDLALNTLRSLRRDLAALDSELQFSFRNSVEPVYRQYIDLLLRSPNPSQDNIRRSIQAVEQLQVAELNNLFRDACAQAKTVDISKLDNNAAIVYPIVLSDRLELILKLPGKNLLYKYTQHGISESQVNLAVEQLQQSLIKRSTSLSQTKQEAGQLYNWLIEPFAQDLETTLSRQQSPIKTIIFVPDRSLRNLPMSVLYDGQHYLIERYAIVTSPGVELIQPESSPKENLKVLLAGATYAPSFEALGLSPLDNVNLELSGIAQTVEQTVELEDGEFLQTNIQEQINTNSFNTIHIATHGKFSSDLEQTYLLDWNQTIGLKDLDRLLEAEDPKLTKPIDLLVLSACETASGDRQAALGLAGVAVRSGASSTIASLWQVNDASTARFMIEFYQQLSNPQLSKAEALRNTQLSFLVRSDTTDYNRPYHWASFILVGDWR